MFLTPQQVSKHLSLALSTTYFYCETGQLPAVRVGKHWRVPSDKLQRWLEKRMNGKKEGR
ncbi:MAG: helix-turn-helix domain-containing protein [Candidatus Peribacteraceae bacterium]|nr:helix-turn-helix domain-containing protein [Candidatus Peribacteraceae bacterium]